MKNIIYVIIVLIIIGCLSVVLYSFIKTDNEFNIKNSRNTVFTKEKRASIDDFECKIRKNKVKGSNKKIDKLFQILGSMKLEEYKSDAVFAGHAINIDIKQKDGSKYIIVIAGNYIEVDNRVYLTDKDYIPEIEAVFE